MFSGWKWIVLTDITFTYGVATFGLISFGLTSFGLISFGLRYIWSNGTFGLTTFGLKYKWSNQTSGLIIHLVYCDLRSNIWQIICFIYLYLPSLLFVRWKKCFLTQQCSVATFTWKKQFFQMLASKVVYPCSITMRTSKLVLNWYMRLVLFQSQKLFMPG